MWCWEQCGSGVFYDIGTDSCFYLCAEFEFGRLYSGPFCDAELVDAGSLFLFLLPLLSGFLVYLKFLFLGMFPSSCLPEVGIPLLLTPP